MRYNKEETRKALIYECSGSTSNREIKKYALEMVEDLDDGEYFRNPTLKNVRKRMLGNLSDYAQTGCGEEWQKYMKEQLVISIVSQFLTNNRSYEVR